MLNRIHVICSDLSLFSSPAAEDPDLFYSLYVDPEDIPAMEAAYQFIAGKTIPVFYLSIKPNKPLTNEICRRLCSFLFLPAYARWTNAFFLAISGDNTELLKEIEKDLRAYFLSQAIDQLILFQLSVEKETGLVIHPEIFESPETLLSHYQKLFESANFYNRDIFFKPADSLSLLEGRSNLDKMELDFRSSSPARFAVAENQLMMVQELASLKRKNMQLETERENQAQYIAILKAGHSARQLQEYYDQEYELLPLWYKRVGHLIKVITGKRTFKSLASNRQKK